MKRACAALLLATLAGCAAAPRLQADPPGVNRPQPPAAPGATPTDPPGGTDIPVDPNIAKASAEADADAGDVEGSNGPQTPYQQALLNYKSGKYAAARVLIENADQSTPGNVPIEMLKARIMTELHDFAGAHHVIDSLYDRPDLSPAYTAALQLTSGDLSLRERKFDAASKAYEQYLSAQPNDTDAKLRFIYARIEAADLVTAGRIASELKPLDAASPAYYFAHAALAHAGVGTDDEDQDIQQARTIYGITLTNRYLKTYLEVFSEKHSVSSALNPPSGSTNAAPSGKAL